MASILDVSKTYPEVCLSLSVNLASPPLKVGDPDGPLQRVDLLPPDHARVRGHCTQRYRSWCTA
jgi:hypothetical protein